MQKPLSRRGDHALIATLLMDKFLLPIHKDSPLNYRIRNNDIYGCFSTALYMLFLKHVSNNMCNMFRANAWQQ